MEYLFPLLFIVISCFLLLITLGFMGFLFISMFLDAPFIPVRKELLSHIYNALNLKSDSILYDLGCGDARVLKYCISIKTGVRGVGVERNFLPYLLAKFNSRNLPIIISGKNILKTDLSNATHIYLYLFPKIMALLLEKIKKECKKGIRVVSCDFKFEGIEPVEVIELPNTKKQLGKKLYVYEL